MKEWSGKIADPFVLEKPKYFPTKEYLDYETFEIQAKDVEWLKNGRLKSNANWITLF